jgi:hypothetical protein
MEEASKKRKVTTDDLIEDQQETPDEKRLRLAQEILHKLGAHETDVEETEIDRDIIAKKLRQEASGRKYQRDLAQYVIFIFQIAYLNFYSSRTKKLKSKK